ncbi:uncharacterized protein EI90DRAFT_2912086 [Cantharellus anzutake]|uniref:uncharacterized protein n=1 Tax=Cantharellus anzutake TaxID=1750568 RepID=UPI00190836BD|nr:uncharacterized protein EI90DRAFT_2912086 [Cantharellus anzutake]KAF8336546.1 hypothetical protein EI90DRAFT_2912086 [Cantharellus anzutake]
MRAGPPLSNSSHYSSGPNHSRQNSFVPLGQLRKVVLPKSALSRFLSIAALNTTQKRETCGLLLGRFRAPVFEISTLLIPKQIGTEDTCTMVNEELVAEVQEKRGLITIGWIHTHPTQSCFMSSLDLHTHSGYQSSLPEAVAIVCAPNHTPNFGIFRLTDPPGLGIVRSCAQKSSFHPHSDSQPIYTDADSDHVQMIEEADLEIIDIR